MSNPEADLLLRNATIYLSRGRWEHGTVAVADGSILAVGSDAGLGGFKGARTEVLDLAGGSLLPGFHDAHVHPLFAGIAMLGIDLSGVHSRAQYAELIRSYVHDHPADPTYTGAGWYGDVYPGGFPTRDELDVLVPDKPIILDSHDAHGVWVNSLVLQLAGIDETTPDPDGGRILKDSAGRPSGVLLDTARGLIEHLLPKPDAEYLIRGMRTAQTRLHTVGVTGWQDALVGVSDLGPNAFEVYRELARTGGLSARVTGDLWWDRNRGLEQIDDLVALREEAAAWSNFKADTIKVMQDGMIENLTAALLHPYCGHENADETGTSLIDPEELKQATAKLDSLGFDIHFHAVGDRAVRECLDAVAHTRAINGRGSGRHQIAHLDLVDPADFERFAELDVAANVQMLWARRDREILERKLPLIGRDREPQHFPYGSLSRAGARIVAGSDWPVSDPNPLWAIYTGTTRLASEDDVHATGEEATSKPLEPGEALEFPIALDAYTINGAYMSGLDDVTGSIAVGKAADLVVLDSDISTGQKLGSARVARTLVSGEVVYEREAEARR